MRTRDSPVRLCENICAVVPKSCVVARKFRAAVRKYLCGCAKILSNFSTPRRISRRVFPLSGQVGPVFFRKVSRNTFGRAPNSAILHAALRCRHFRSEFLGQIATWRPRPWTYHLRPFLARVQGQFQGRGKLRNNSGPSVARRAYRHGTSTSKVSIRYADKWRRGIRPTWIAPEQRWYRSKEGGAIGGAILKKMVPPMVPF